MPAQVLVFDPRQLMAFVAAVFVLVIVPGPNTMIIIAQSLAGRMAGLATVAGVELGTLIHTLAVALGLAALLAAFPIAFNLVRLAGIAYLIVVGSRTLLTQPPRPQSGHAAIGARVAFQRALLTNLLNPKSAVFFLAFLPQFVHPERGRVFLQFLLLGLIVSLVGTCIGIPLVLVAATLSRWVQSHESFRRWQQRITGLVFIGIAVALALVHSQ